MNEKPKKSTFVCIVLSSDLVRMYVMWGDSESASKIHRIMHVLTSDKNSIKKVENYWRVI